MEIKIPIYFTDRVKHNDKAFGIAYLNKTSVTSNETEQGYMNTLDLIISDDNINILKNIIKNFEDHKSGSNMYLKIYLYNDNSVEKYYNTYNETYVAIRNKEESINTYQYSEKLISLAMEYGYTVIVYSSPSKVKYLN